MVAYNRGRGGFLRGCGIVIEGSILRAGWLVPPREGTRVVLAPTREPSLTIWLLGLEE